MARNASGTYSLPSGNPVASGATIESAWANTTLSDVATGITNSLDRQGRGGMLAPLRVTDESAATPAWSFTNEVSSGFYRSAAGDVRFSLLTADLLQFKSAWANLWDGAAWQPIVAAANGTNDGDILLWDTGNSAWEPGALVDFLPTATDGQMMVKGSSAWEATDAVQLDSSEFPWFGEGTTAAAGLRVVGISPAVAVNANAASDSATAVTKTLAISATTLTLDSTTGALTLKSATTDEDLVLNASGQVLIGDVAAGNVKVRIKGVGGAETGLLQCLDAVSGTVFLANEDGTIQMPQLGTGSGTPIEISSNVLVRDTSSRRFKKAIKDYPDALADLARLRPRVYQRKDNGALEAGFIAEEMHDAGLTRYVAYEDGKPISVHYGKITAMLAAALQQLTAAPAA